MFFTFGYLKKVPLQFITLTTQYYQNKAEQICLPLLWGQDANLDMHFCCRFVHKQSDTEYGACTQNGAKAQIVVAVARTVVVAIGNPQVPRVVVPAAAAFHAVGPAYDSPPFLVMSQSIETLYFLYGIVLREISILG